MGHKNILHGVFWVVLVVTVLTGLPGCAQKQPQAHSKERSVVLSDGVPLDYRVLGGGRPLLVLTGYAMTKEMWDLGFLRELAISRQVILMDNRGMGPSPLDGAAEISMTRMALDAAAVLDDLGITSADVLGWSMGGMIAQELALARPDKVRSMVLLASASDIGPLVPELERMNALSGDEVRRAMFPPDWISSHPEAYSRIPPRPRPPDMRVVKGQYAAMLHWSGTSSRLRSMSAPVLLLVGAEDWVCPPEASQNMFDLLSERADAPVFIEIVAHGSHWMMHQFPEELARMVNDFLFSPTLPLTCGEDTFYANAKWKAIPEMLH